jgi:hypothetical protein
MDVRGPTRFAETFASQKTCRHQKFAVIPAKARIHLDLDPLVERKNGFPLSRE